MKIAPNANERWRINRYVVYVAIDNGMRNRTINFIKNHYNLIRNIHFAINASICATERCQHSHTNTFSPGIGIGSHAHKIRLFAWSISFTLLFVESKLFVRFIACIPTYSNRTIPFNLSLFSPSFASVWQRVCV